MSLHPNELIYPVFIKEEAKKSELIPSLPGQLRYSIADLKGLAHELSELGITKVLVFGIPSGRDESARNFISQDGIIQRSIPIFSSKKISTIADVCVCQYTPHGECRILTNGGVDEGKSRQVLSKIALSLAQAGTDWVAPSAVLDGQVSSIRENLDINGYTGVKIMSYSAKFASTFYRPFREAVESDYPGGLRDYQIPCHDKNMALERIIREVKEGSDSIIVKPALPYLDVIAEAKKKTVAPVVAYQVSGEYAMLKSLDDVEPIIESLHDIKRAGADQIISYASYELLKEGFL